MVPVDDSGFKQYDSKDTTDSRSSLNTLLGLYCEYFFFVFPTNQAPTNVKTSHQDIFSTAVVSPFENEEQIYG